MNTPKHKMVNADLSESGKHIEVYFVFTDDNVAKAKKVSGGKFISRTKSDTGQPYWRYPLDWSIAQELRELYGDNLVIGEKLTSWGHSQRSKHSELGTLAAADDAKLKVLPKKLPKLFKRMRAYQRADTAFLAAADNPLNANQQRLGKTIEVIGSVFEAERDEGTHLIVCPKIAIDNVWQKELEEWQPHDVFPCLGGRRKRERVIDDFIVHTQVEKKPGWLIVNPQMVSYRRISNPAYDPEGKPGLSKEVEWNGNKYIVPVTSKYLLDEDGNEILEVQYPWLFSIDWDHVIVDECHKGAIRNPNRLSAKAMYALPLAEKGKRIALSGTPMTKRGPDLWSTLHFLNPEKFSNKWQWLGQWFEMSAGYRNSKVVGQLKEHRKEEFFKSLTPYLLRRTLAEARPELGDFPQRQDIWVEMEGGQKDQYYKMAQDAEIQMGEDNIAATSILAILTRLKQFAVAKQHIVGGRLTPTTDSCKLRGAEEILDELGIFDDETENKVVIASQFKEVAYMVHEWLTKTKKVKASLLTGDQVSGGKKGEAKQIMDDFAKDGGVRVMCLVTDAGGVGIDLSRANYGICLDEKWSHADQEQLEFRLVGQTPETAVAFWYYIRTKLSVDSDIMEVVLSKKDAHEEILDRRRKGKLKLTKTAKEDDDE